MAQRHYWRICGHKKFDIFFDQTIPAGCIADDQLKELLKCLTAKATLSYKEIVGAYVKRKTKRAHGLLNVQGDGFGYFCGNDPSFVAALVDGEQRPIPKPRLPWA
ncbi:MAG: hypothetical protein WA184_01645 [Stellaceae bacterium]|jgi:hypothetical protein